MWDLVLSSLYLFLPAYAANMAPVVVNHLPWFPRLARPLDGGRVLAGQPLLGPHKTVRGVVAGLAAGILTAYLQLLFADLHPFVQRLTLFPFHEQSAFLWGILLGGGALAGDIAKSFVKRRFGIPPGRRWFPWDQLDMAVGGLLFGALLFPFSGPTVLTILLLTPLLGLVVNLGGYILRVKEAW